MSMTVQLNTLHTETKKRLPDSSSLCSTWTYSFSFCYCLIEGQGGSCPQPPFLNSPPFFSTCSYPSAYVQYQPNCLYFQAKTNEHSLSCINKGQIEQFPIKQSHRAITRLVKIDTIDIHCHCRMPENPQDRIILCNGGCKQWYHETLKIISSLWWCIDKSETIHMYKISNAV